MIKKSWITPSWLILTLDLGCATVAICLAFLLRLNFDLDTFEKYPITNIITLVVGVNLLLSLLLRSYSGIVRHTSLADIGRISFVNVISAIAYCTIDATEALGTGAHVFPVSVILINFFINTFFQLSYRLIVKWLFKYYNSFRAISSTKAAVFNSSHSGLVVRRAIAEDPNASLRVVAFLDEKRRSGKRLEGLPIYAATKASLEKLARESKVKLLIIAEENIAPGLLNELVEHCILLDIRVQKVLPADKWINEGWSDTQLKDINIEDLLERSVIEIKNEQVSRELKGKAVLVTGAAGSIGSELVRQLAKLEPSAIILCDKAESPLHELEMEMLEKAPETTIVPYIANICDRVRMQQLFEVYEPAIVYHAAAYKHVPMMEKNPSIAVLNNVMGTKIIAELAVEFGAEKFVMVSTDKAVNPTNVMGASKRIAEIFAQAYNNHLTEQYNKLGKKYGPPTRFITTRFGNVLGSNGSVIPRFKKQLEKGGPLTVTHPEITRYFMTIPEACQLVLEAGAMGKGGEIFVFDMGQPVKIADLATKMIRMSGKEPGRDIKVVFTGLRPGEKLYEELLNNAENTMPTYHEKIMIATVRTYDFTEVNEGIDNLITAAHKHYITPTVVLMKQLVPEFISKNSAYEQLDKDKIKM
ncbi:polysaccharide biosynthesis protein [Chitinophaga pendula]|uniref:polysaccharide biosynthesis protein n=1 Tax=Chitinophaga TaxID=79328 RepID=UPI000BAFC18F|nr:MULTISPECIES: nucleoside-diphosphate sugar epimerase/dehydratase [Chitinophaga]ASZ12386.1 polysaccharide biosynthesis protein [Chitinophaga sp. MD30]UCJ10016.1 polysaccharide biosynthesis protein [Chitinophaga pendula]